MLRRISEGLPPRANPGPPDAKASQIKDRARAIFEGMLLDVEAKQNGLRAEYEAAKDAGRTPDVEVYQKTLKRVEFRAELESYMKARLPLAPVLVNGIQ